MGSLNRSRAASRLKDRIKQGRRRSQRLESDTLSSLLCHASTHSNVSFSPHTGEGVSTKRAFRVNSLSLSLFKFCFNCFFPDRNTDQDSLGYALRFYMHPDSLMWQRVNMCLLLPSPLERFQSTE